MDSTLLLASFLAQGFLIQNVTVYVGDGTVQNGIRCFVEGDAIKKMAKDLKVNEGFDRY